MGAHSLPLPATGWKRFEEAALQCFGVEAPFASVTFLTHSPAYTQRNHQHTTSRVHICLRHHPFISSSHSISGVGVAAPSSMLCCTCLLCCCFCDRRSCLAVGRLTIVYSAARVEDGRHAMSGEFAY